MDEDIKIIVINQEGTMDFLFRNLENQEELNFQRIDNSNIEELIIQLEQLKQINEQFLAQGKSIKEKYHFKYFIEYLNKFFKRELLSLNLSRLNINFEYSNMELLRKLTNLFAKIGNVIIVNSENAAVIDVPSNKSDKQVERLDDLRMILDVNKAASFEEINRDGKVNFSLDGTLDEIIKNIAGSKSR